ncbi:ABC transporter ATP-binding protein [Pseudomonas sp. 148P]|uniref:ABC transporter ATP-binding protein n=1 Tax=Pseudomonas ulcerans TaxID=3115852 RepID=A0ABU7HTH9_9PSED|nr:MULTISPECIES: ABC transporter ATP-binding protein [unclassified Pseudomonas]MEE1925887.1 ABC transporter ATP-binding protein [Pseudomonas sp. 147P]MEE1934758.1 ABC transporter ATP-binding protein [Pseudomonas sp. 148P]
MNAFDQCTAALECSGLGYQVKGTALLDGVSLQVRPGETLGIVGPNGSGKSTLLRLLAGLLRPHSGEVRLNGEPMHRLRRREVARQLAVVEQQASTDDALRVRDAVELGRTPWLSALSPWSAADDGIVDQALQAVGMAHLAQRLWHSLSGGERQRVHIARALAQQPRILLLDEPTNHLDIQQQLGILALVQALPVTTLIALHDLNQALGCDRLALMDHGRLVALGAPLDVLTPQRLHDTFGVHGHFIEDPLDGSRYLRLRAR